MSTVLLLLALLALVLLNGFFVAAEFALVRARSTRLEEMQREGSRAAKLASGQVEKISQYLSACQVGITMASIGIGFLGEPVVARMLERPLGGVVSHGVAVVVGLVIAYVLVTGVHIILGEQVPKLYSITHAERIMRVVARPLQWFQVAFGPAIWALNATSNRLLRLLGVDPDADLSEGTGADDLKLLINRGMLGGTLDPGEAVMLSGVFHLHEQEARQIMTPIPAVVTVDISEDVETALQRCVESGHTRLVVIEDENTDRVRGIVHNNSLARLLMRDGADAPIESIVRDVPLVPETKPLDDLLADLQRERSSLAIVVDEYGRTIGLVSVEDILEEVVGEIADETDPARGSVRQLSNGDWYVRGHVPVNDLADYGLDLPVDSGSYNSVGGLVFGELGRLPKRGDTVRVNGYSLRVESVRENRIDAVRIRQRQASEQAWAQDSTDDG